MSFITNFNFFKPSGDGVIIVPPVASFSVTEFQNIDLAPILAQGWVDLDFIPKYPSEVFLMLRDGIKFNFLEHFTIVENASGELKRLTWDPAYVGTPGEPPVTGLVGFLVGTDQFTTIYERETVANPTVKTEFENIPVSPYLVQGYFDLAFEPIFPSETVAFIRNGIIQAYGIHFSVIDDGGGNIVRFTWDPAVDPTLTTGLVGFLNSTDEFTIIYERNLP